MRQQQDPAPHHEKDPAIKRFAKEDLHVNKWSIRDIIDFEYFFYRDAAAYSDEQQQHLNKRDRAIYLESVRPQAENDGAPDRRFILRTWLNQRRKQEGAETAVLPGESFESLYSSFRILFILAGIILGGGAGLSFLSYTGARPLNVFVYLFVFVFSQLLLLLLLFIFSAYRLQKKTLSFSPLYRAIGRFMLAVLLWVRSRMSEKMRAEHRSKVQAALGFIMNRGRTYGILFLLPVFILTQLFALGFNLGLLAITLFKVITADIAFGWQSTLRLSPEAVHGLVQKIALPWSWLISPDIAHPSLAQIEGSRIILKEGIYHLATPDLASWWPFLCFSVLVYGLLPRLLFFAGGFVLQQQKLSTIKFRQGDYEQLLLRMTSPLVTTRGSDPESCDSSPEEEESAYNGNGTAADINAITRNLLVLVPGDIYDACTEGEIQAAVQQRFNTLVTKTIRIEEEYETDLSILTGLKNNIDPANTDILLIQEAWQPPITEYLNFIKNLRIDIGHGPCLRIGLTGKPMPGRIFTPIQEENRKIWARKITAIGDPCIYVVEMVNNAG